MTEATYDPKRLESLGQELAEVFDGFAARHPDMTPVEACGALGAVAGTIVALTIPHGRPDIDDIACQAIGVMFGAALNGIRLKRAS